MIEASYLCRAWLKIGWRRQGDGWSFGWWQTAIAGNEERRIEEAVIFRFVRCTAAVIGVARPCGVVPELFSLPGERGREMIDGNR